MEVIENDLVSEATSSLGWIIRTCRGSHLREITESIKATHPPSPTAGTRCSFMTMTIDRVYMRNTLGSRSGYNTYALFSCFLNRILRCSFITWVAFKDRLATESYKNVYYVVKQMTHATISFCLAPTFSPRGWRSAHLFSVTGLARHSS